MYIKQLFFFHVFHGKIMSLWTRKYQNGCLKTVIFILPITVQANINKAVFPLIYSEL